MEWKNKIAIITGAGTGIGKATKDLLRSRGTIVYNLDKEMAADEIKEFFAQCDVRKRSDIAKAVQSVFNQTNRIDMLFANAGIHLFGGIEDTSDAEFDDVINTNIGGTFFTLKAVLPIMRAQQNGNIVLMGSDQSHVGKAKSAVYGLTKGAIGQLTKSTAIDYAAYNIRVNCICPGTIDTPLLHKAVERYHSLTGEDKDGVYKSLVEVQPLRRIGKPEEIAEVVVFLLSDENSFMTGSLVSVDGGYVSQ